MVHLEEIEQEVVEMNLGNLRNLKIEELLEMLEPHVWQERVVLPSEGFMKLVKYVLGKRNVSCS